MIEDAYGRWCHVESTTDIGRETGAFDAFDNVVGNVVFLERDGAEEAARAGAGDDYWKHVWRVHCLELEL